MYAYTQHLSSYLTDPLSRHRTNRRRSRHIHRLRHDHALHRRALLMPFISTNPRPVCLASPMSVVSTSGLNLHRHEIFRESRAGPDFQADEAVALGEDGGVEGEGWEGRGEGYVGAVTAVACDAGGCGGAICAVGAEDRCPSGASLGGGRGGGGAGCGDGSCAWG